MIYDEVYPASQELIDLTRKEEKFMDEYYKRTGLHYRHYFGPNGPRPPPAEWFWPASSIGAVHTVSTTAGYWNCHHTDKTCYDNNPLTFELEVISQTPRAFIIPNFLSEYEIKHIIDLAKPTLHTSAVGDAEAGGVFESSTRTSLNSWIKRQRSIVMQNLYNRAAHVLRIDEDYMSRNSEDIQVVHYEHGQEYQAHHDWLVDTLLIFEPSLNAYLYNRGDSGYPESRLLTLLLYLNDQSSPHAGGDTSFPKGGIKVHPGKGNAVLFYDLLEDGNGDELSLHAATPVVEG